MTARRGIGFAELAATVEALPGTVTELLERLAGEAVDAEVLSQRRTPAPVDNGFGLVAGAELVSRSVLLTGRGSGRAFVYACSTIAADRLPAAALRRLEETREPLGRVLTDLGVEARREPVPGPPTPPPDGVRLLSELGGAAMARRYRIASGGTVAVDVSEWFLPVTCEVLAARSGSPGPSPRR
jgi:chorismate--pyruvate lyase